MRYDPLDLPIARHINSKGGYGGISLITIFLPAPLDTPQRLRYDDPMIKRTALTALLIALTLPACATATRLTPETDNAPNDCQEDEACWDCSTMGNGICADQTYSIWDGSGYCFVTGGYEAAQLLASDPSLNIDDPWRCNPQPGDSDYCYEPGICGLTPGEYEQLVREG